VIFKGRTPQDEEALATVNGRTPRSDEVRA